MVRCNLYAKNEISTHLQIVSLGVKKKEDYAPVQIQPFFFNS